MDDGLAFTRQLLLAFLFGFAIATGVSILVLPITSRRNVFTGVRNYAAAIKAVLDAQAAFFRDSQGVLPTKVTQSHKTDLAYLASSKSLLETRMKLKGRTPPQLH
jgi:hypothetical protein